MSIATQVQYSSSRSDVPCPCKSSPRSRMVESPHRPAPPRPCPCICECSSESCSRPTSGSCGSWSGTWGSRAAVGAAVQVPPQEGAGLSRRSVYLVINSCNLRCQGCWVDVAAKQQVIDAAAMRKLINEAKAAGNVFFGIVGGEPFMHPNLLDILAEHPECYFQIFTNGHFITDEVAKRIRQLGNVTPLISVEGSEIVSDERRGRAGVLSKTMQGVENCLKNKVFTGVCTSVCKTNIDDLVTEKWVDRLIEMGVFYTWFHVYRPMGPEANEQLCLSHEMLRIRKFVVEMRARKPIVFVDAYYDHAGQALCRQPPHQPPHQPRGRD